MPRPPRRWPPPSRRAPACASARSATARDSSSTASRCQRAAEGRRAGGGDRAGSGRPACPAQPADRGRSSRAAATARNYLRQIVYRLRRALPPDLSIASGGGRLAWRPAEAVASDDALLESLIGPGPAGGRRAPHGHPARRRRLAGRGPYLQALEDESVVARRRHLAGVAQEVRLEYARAMRAGGQRGREALRSGPPRVAEDPYREDAWQELMRIGRPPRRAGVGGPRLPRLRAVARSEVDLQPSRRDPGPARAAARVGRARARRPANGRPDAAPP